MFLRKCTAIRFKTTTFLHNVFLDRFIQYRSPEYQTDRC